MNEVIDIKRAVDQCCVINDMAQNQVAFFSDISASRFSRGMSGESPFSDRERERIVAVIEAIGKLQEVADPYPISWSQVHRLKPFIDQHMKSNEDALHKVCWYIRFSLMNFLQGFRSDGTPIETINWHNEGAAFISFDLANKISRRLKEQGIENRVERLSADRRLSTITTSLEQLGLKEVTVEQVNNAK